MNTNVKQRQESDSGVGSENEDSHAIRDFFQTYVRHLEVAVQRNSSSSNFDDPSIDLGEFGKAPPSPIPQRRSTETFVQCDRKDSTLDELEVITGQIERKNGYSQKLANIMLKGLQQTLGDDMYKSFLQGRLPVNWLPIVRFNNDNTPYVEFLVKSDVADQDPDAQLSDYTMKHIVHSKYIVDFLYNSTKQMKLTSASSTRPVQKSRQSAPPNPIRAPPQKTCRLSEGHRLRDMEDPLVSTPLSQRKKPTCQPRINPNLNDSKRVLPVRACKLNTTLTYPK